MGGTCSNVPNVQELPKKILIVGFSGTGKTHLLYSWVLGHTDITPIPTDSFNVETVKSSSGQLYMIWDLCGTDIFKFRRRQFFHGTEGIIYMIDATQDKDADKIKLDFLSILQERDFTNIPLLVLINKMDSPDSESTDIADKWRKLLNLGELIDRDWEIASISVTDTENVKDALQTLDKLFKEMKRRQQLVKSQTLT